MTEEPLTEEEHKDYMAVYWYLKAHPIIEARLFENPEWEPNKLWAAMQKAESLEEYRNLDRKRARAVIAEWRQFRNEIEREQPRGDYD